MTAFEISQRQAEQLGDFTPSFGRRVTEFLNPLMIRIFGILYRAGKFGAPPDSLMTDAGGGKRGLALPNVIITNRLTDALKALKNRATEQTFQFLLPQVELGMTQSLDIFDMDKVNREYAINSGMPPDLIRPTNGKGSIAFIRSERAKAQQQQQAAATAEQMSAAGKNLAQAPDWMQEQAKAAVMGGRKSA